MTSGLDQQTSGEVRERLTARLPAGMVVTDPDIMGSFVHDEAEWAPFGQPVAVVRPRTTPEVAEVVSACAATGTPLVTRGPVCPVGPTPSTGASSSPPS
jgi:glycolate oxidase